MPRRRCGRSANQQPRGGERHGRCRRPDRLVMSMGWARAAAKQSPRPPATAPQEGARMDSSQTLDQASPSWGRDGSSPHPALQHRTVDARPTTCDLEQAFDRLNPDYGVPADPHNPYGHQALRDREAALSLGTRVAVAASRENDPNPVMWLAGQDYRAIDTIRTARLELGRSRRGPQRLGPER